jgi:hypothetical protein
MTPVYEGKAKAGDLIRTWWGQELIVVSVVGAGDLIEAVVERRIAMRAPNFMRDSIAASCALWGATSAREKRDNERRRHRATKLIRSVA